jgi:hypothetical protein
VSEGEVRCKFVAGQKKKRCRNGFRLYLKEGKLSASFGAKRNIGIESGGLAGWRDLLFAFLYMRVGFVLFGEGTLLLSLI